MTQPAPDTFRALGRSDAIPDGFVVARYLADAKLRVALARVDGRLYVFDDLCTCALPRCPLSGGLMTGLTIMCQCHGSRFELTSGAVVSGPATEPLRRHEVREVDGDVLVRLDSDLGSAEKKSQ